MVPATTQTDCQINTRRPMGSKDCVPRMCTYNMPFGAQFSNDCWGTAHLGASLMLQGSKGLVRSEAVGFQLVAMAQRTNPCIDLRRLPEHDTQPTSTPCPATNFTCSEVKFQPLTRAALRLHNCATQVNLLCFLLDRLARCRTSRLPCAGQMATAPWVAQKALQDPI